MDTARAPAAPAAPSAASGLVLATIFALTFAEFVQAGMTAFAAAPLMGGIGLAPDEFTLVAAVYASVAILAISMQRWCVERIGGRRFVQAGAAIAALGSALCACSHDLPGFLVGRAVMALGGGAYFTAARMIIQHALPGPRRFAGVRALASGLAIGIAAAPWLASVAVSADAWQAMYAGMAMLDLAVVVLAAFALPVAPIGEAASRSRMQPAAQGLLAVASFGLLLALQRVVYDAHGEWVGATLALAGSVVALAAWLAWQARAPRPLLRVRALRDARYLGGLALFAVAFVVLSANNAVVPQLLQGALGHAWQTVGRLEAAGLAAAVLTWAAMSCALPRHPSPRKYLVTGFVALAASGALMTRLVPDADPWWSVLPALALNSVFLLTVLPVTAMQAFRAVDRDEAVFSNAQQLKNMLSQAAIAAGITLATLGQQWRMAVHGTVLVERLDASSPAMQSTLADLQRAFGAGMGPEDAARAALAQVGQMLGRQASLLAGIDHFGAVALLGAIGVAVLAWQKLFR